MTRSALLQTARRLLADEKAATAIEYAMIAGGIAAVIAAAITATGGSVKGMYDAVAAVMP